MPEKVFEYNDPNLEYEAIIVIDSLKSGQSSGGIRISDTLDRNEIAEMAHSMTMKYGILRRNMGGAKCGIQLPKDCTADQKNQILQSFGMKAAHILQNKTYIPYMDMNCTKENIYTILQTASSPVYKISDSSFFTALSVVSSIKAACRFKNMKIPQLSCIIEGFGNVGSHIAEILNSYDVRIIGISTQNGAIYNPDGFNVQQLVRQRKSYGDDLIGLYPDHRIKPKESLLQKNCDFLIPCARYHSIHHANMKEISTHIIAPGANNPYDVEIDYYLHDRQILCLPDFITNIGGILGTSLFDNQVPIKQIHHFFNNDFQFFMLQLLKYSKQYRITPIELAVILAEHNLEDKKQLSTTDSSHQKSGRKLGALFTYISSLPLILQQQFYVINEKRNIMKNLQTIKKISDQ